MVPHETKISSRTSRRYLNCGFQRHRALAGLTSDVKLRAAGRRPASSGAPLAAHPIMPVQVARRRANSRRGSRLGRREKRRRTVNFNDELGGRESLLATLEYGDTSWCTLAGTVKKRDLERRL